MGNGYIDPNMPLNELVKRQRKLYKTFVPVRCYLLSKEIVFTFAGFEHLHVDGRKRRRGEKNARSRLILLEHVPAVITQARIMKKDIKLEHESYSGKKESYYELYSKVGVKQLPVVLTLRQIGDGALHFYGIRCHIRNKQKKTP